MPTDNWMAHFAIGGADQLGLQRRRCLPSTPLRRLSSGTVHCSELADRQWWELARRVTRISKTGAEPKTRAPDCTNHQGSLVLVPYSCPISRQDAVLRWCVAPHAHGPPPEPGRWRVCGELKSRTRCFSSAEHNFVCCVSCNFSFAFSSFMLRKVKVCANARGWEECALNSRGLLLDG